MLWFVGTGINGYRGLSIVALDVLKKCDTVYIERFTSALSTDDLHGLNSLLEVNAKPVQRWFVEDGREILEEAKTKDIALVTYGDPLIATTHIELRSESCQELHQDRCTPCCIRNRIHNRRGWTAYLQVWQDCDNDV